MFNTNPWIAYYSTTNRIKSTYIQGFLDVSGNIILRNGGFSLPQGDVSMNGNLYVGLDASMNRNLFVGLNSTMRGNVNIQGNLVVNKPVLQTLSSDPSYNAVNGYYALAENVQPIVSQQTAYDIGKNWQSASTGIVGVTIYSVCWSPQLNLFCITANDWVIVSNDGLTWRSYYIGATPGLHGMASVCWSSELERFCTVAFNANYAAVSSNGTTWTAATTVPAGSWVSVCWSPELGIFCAVAAVGTSGTGNNQVMVSNNGTSWSSTNVSNVLPINWDGICWSPELRIFCAVARTGTTNQCVMVSSNGLNWQNATSGVLSNSWVSVCWSPELGLFCAVASSGTTNQRVMVSSDGLNWRNAISGVLSVNWGDICWAPQIGLFCAIGTTGTTNQRVMVSRDGLNWQNASSGVLNNEFYSVCWSPELSSFVSVSYAYAMITDPEYRLPTTKTIKTLVNDGNYNVNVKSTTSSGSFPTYYYNNNANMIKIGNTSFFDLSYISFNETFDNGSTRGTFGWDLSANNGDITTQITNPGTYLSMVSWNTVGFKSINLPIAYSSTKFNNIAFNISLTNGRNVIFLLGISNNINIFNATNKIGFYIANNAANDGSMNIFVRVNSTDVYTLTSSAFANIQYILNMDFFSNYIVFSVAHANTPTIIIGSYTYNSIPSYNSYIGTYFSSNTAVGNSRFAYIHDIKWTLSSDITRFDNSISIGNTNKQDIPYQSYVNKYSNIGVGNNIFTALTSGFQNIGIGNTIATVMTSGHNNVFIGNGVATSTTSTGNTVAIGTEAGKTNTTGINNTYLGAFTDAISGTYNNSTAIGYGTTITASNQIKIGRTSESIIMNGTVAIGNVNTGSTPGNNPASVLYVECPSNNTITYIGGMRISQNTQNSSSDATLLLSTNNSTSGNPYISYDITNVCGYSMGIDNADDTFKIASIFDFTRNANFSTNIALQIYLNDVVRINNNVLNNKMLVLYEVSTADAPSTATNFYGFGMNNSTLRYQVDSTGAFHRFYCGASEVARMTTGQNVFVVNGSNQTWPSGWSGGMNVVDIACSGVHYNGLVARSDRRLKTNIETYEKGLSELMIMRPVSFTWIQHPGFGTQYGFIAQEIEEILPEKISVDENGFKSLKNNFETVIVNSIQEQQTMIENRQNRLKALEARLAAAGL